jgi:hypothetical protein
MIELAVDSKDLTGTFFLYPEIKASEKRFKWFTLDPIFLNSGSHVIDLIATNRVELDQIVLFSINNASTLDDFFKVECIPSKISYEAISPTKYIVHIKTPKPLFLVLSVSYHEGWVAYFNEEKSEHRIASLPLYSFVNGFYIDRTGEFQLTLEFSGQKYVTYGWILTALSIFLVITYLAGCYYKKLSKIISKGKK